MIQGHCLCGAVRYETDGKVLWSGFCHCASCRRSIGAPVAAFVGVEAAEVRWPGEATKIYESSPGVRRRFCAACGTPIAYEADMFPGELHLYTATLDDPDSIPPTFHVFFDEHIGWFDTADDLPRHKAGGTSELMDR